MLGKKKLVGDPGIEPGVRLREGVTVPIKLINFNCLIRFGPKDISTTKRILGTNVFCIAEGLFAEDIQT